MKLELAHLFRLRDALDRMEVDLGLGELNDLDRRVLEALGHGAEGRESPLTIRYVLESSLLSGYSRASIYRSLKGLETQGYVTVTQDERDARRSFVTLSSSKV